MGHPVRLFYGHSLVDPLSDGVLADGLEGGDGVAVLEEAKPAHGGVNLV